MNRSLLASLALCAVLWCAGDARAHEVRPAYLGIEEIAPDRFDVRWKGPSNGPLVLYLRPTLSNGLLDANPDEEYSADSFVVRRWRGRTLARDSFDGATVRIEGLQHTLTDALVIIKLASGQQIQTLLKPRDPQFTIRLTGAGKTPVPQYLTLGIEHILTGFDHLSFVLGLVMLVHGRLRLLKTVTAFTLAHSVTLAAAALGYVRISAPVIESLVALSIVFVALEVVRAWHGRRGVTAQRPWLIAFTFGLLHGLAFAGSLTNIGLPSQNVPGALLLFNCGVEIGQLMFVGAVLLCIAIWRRLPRSAAWIHARWLTPYCIGALACYWMIERVDVLLR